MKLLRRPAHGLAGLFREGARIRARHLCKDRNLAIALDKLHGHVEVQQTRECFTWHRPRKHIAPDHHAVYLCLTNVL